MRWIGDDLRGGDAVVLLQSAEEKGGEMTSRLALKLGEAAIPYEITSTPSSKEGLVQGTCRFVIASENDAFCSAAIREIALMNIRGGRNAVLEVLDDARRSALAILPRARRDAGL